MPADPVEVIARAIDRCLLGTLAATSHDYARAVLAALEGEGLVVVPREPSKAMVHAGGAAHDYPSVYMGGPSHNGRRVAKRVWETMILMHEERPR